MKSVAGVRSSLIGWKKILGGIGLGIVASAAVRMLAGPESRLAEYRYNLVLATAGGQVEFVSIDPVERAITRVRWPSQLVVTSRSVGSYRVGELYQLGEYEQRGGEFVRQKTQGFMKVPVMGFIAVPTEKEVGLSRALLIALTAGEEVSSLTRPMSLLLAIRSMTYRQELVGEAELARAGIVVKTEKGVEYQEGRLRESLGMRIVDWRVGEESLTAAIVNEAGKAGLASDMGEFLLNSGMDVVSVRSGEARREQTEILIGQLGEERVERVKSVLTAWFGWENYQITDTSEYRADLVIRLGSETEELF